MLSIFKNGIEYSLDDSTLCSLIGDAGWGMAKVRRLSESGPLQHAETDVGYRLETRVGQLVLQINANSRDNLYEMREDLTDIFAPSDTPMKLRWTLSSKTRQIDCHAVSIEFDSQDRSGFSQKGVFMLRCPDAVFYDPVVQSVVFSLGGGTDSYAIPHPIPHVVGSSVLDVSSSVTVQGNWNSYPHQLRITGPITDPIITNENTGAVLDFTGITIGTGNYYDLDLRYGYKTIQNQLGVNKIHELTADSDLSSWVLLSKTETVGGTNSIKVTGTAVTEETSVSIDWFDNYLGI